MRRIEFQITMVILVLLCSSVTLAGQFYPKAYHLENYWNVLDDWFELSGDALIDATRLPGSTDGIWMDYTQPNTPMIVPDDYTASCYWMYLGHGPGDTGGDTLDIYGTLNLYDPAINTVSATPGFLIFGNQGDDTVYPAASATVTIHPGGYLETGEIWTSLTANSTYTHYIIQDGGVFKADFMLSNLYNYYGSAVPCSKLEYALNDGTLFLGRGMMYYPNYSYTVTSDLLTIDIAGGTVIMPEASLVGNIDGGVILANGTTVTAENADSLLYVDDRPYRDVIWRGANRNLVAVSNNTGQPSETSDLYVSQWTMDDDAANTAVADSTGENDGTFSDATGNPNTSAHHSTDSMEGTGSLEFDGVDDYVELPRNAALETGNIYSESGMMSVSAWIKHDTSADNNATIVGTGTGGWYLGTVGTADTISFVCSLGDPNGAASETVTVTDTTPVFDGQWHHVVATFDGSELNLYVDDSRESTEMNLLSDYAVIENGGDNPVLIGENAGTTGSYWKGLIDDVRMYQFALNSEEVYHWNHPKCAWNPNYPNGAWWVDPNDVVLQWSPGDGADSHDVYFGKRLKSDIARGDGLSTVNIDDLELLATGWLTNSDGSGLAEPNDIVDFADFAVMASEWGQTSLVYQGNTTDPNFVAATNASPLDSQTIYEWRVDEVDNDTATTCTGRVWGFITE